MKQLRKASPFDKAYCKIPPVENALLENNLLQFKQKVLKAVKKTHVSSNISDGQRTALREMRKNIDLHFSVADKTSEFVVMKNSEHITITKHHLSNETVYETIKMARNEKEVTKQLKKLAETIQTNVNNKWRDICCKRNIPKKICEIFLVSQQHEYK